MRPQWFSITDSSSHGVTSGTKTSSPEFPSIQYEKMWEDDQYWMPLLLAKRHFVGRADFKLASDEYCLKRWWFGVSSEDVI